MPIKRSSLLAALLVGLVVAPAARADLPPRDEYVPTFAQSAYWLHANGSPLGNVDAQQGKYVKWDTTQPTGAQPAHYVGNNYSQFVGENHDPVQFMTMQGKVKGDLDNLAFDLYLTGPSQSTVGCGISLSVELKIDGTTIVNQDYTGSEGFPYQVVDDTTVSTGFVLTHLWDAIQQYKLPYGPDALHDVYLNLQNFYACNEFVWRYDSTAYPARFKANLADPSYYFEFNVGDPPPPLAASARLSMGF
jgi:hypothetical protein